jgi:hypothetical protein
MLVMTGTVAAPGRPHRMVDAVTNGARPAKECLTTVGIRAIEFSLLLLTHNKLTIFEALIHAVNCLYLAG